MIINDEFVQKLGIYFLWNIVNDYICKDIEGIKDFRKTCGVCLVRIKLEEMDGDGLQLKNRMHIAREIESSYNDSRK